MDQVGIDVEVPQPDFGKIMDKVDDIVQRIYSHETPDIFENHGIDVCVDESGTQFIDNHTITIGKETLSADHIIICSGSSPRMLDIPGIEKANILHNENFRILRDNPERLVLIGGGVIFVEIDQSVV